MQAVEEGALPSDKYVPEGSGTPSDPYTLGTAESFAWWALLHPETCAKLDADIDLTVSEHGDATWPGDTVLTAALDGQDRTVLFRTTGAGLFAEIAESGSVEWLRLGETSAQKAQGADGASVSAEGGLAGSVAGINKGTIAGVVNRMDVEAAAEDASVDALAGGIAAVNDGTIVDCANIGAVANAGTSDGSAAGGIAAKGTGTIATSYNAGGIQAACNGAYIVTLLSAEDGYADHVDDASCYLAPGQGAVYEGVALERNGALSAAELQEASERLNAGRTGEAAVWASSPEAAAGFPAPSKASTAAAISAEPNDPEATPRMSDEDPVLGAATSWGMVGAQQTLADLKASKDIEDGTGGELVLNSAEALAWYAVQVNFGKQINGTLAGSVPVRLGQDIDLAGTQYGGTAAAPLLWVPIGGGSSSNTWLQAKFDGDGHTVKNLSVGATLQQYQGFIGYSANNTVSNLSVSGTIDMYFTGGTTAITRAALVVAYADNVTITGCSASGSVTAQFSNSAETYAGGILGEGAGNTAVSDCVNSAAVALQTFNGAGGKHSAGGVVGTASQVSSIERCSNTASVYASASAGGIVGIEGDARIANCYNAGAVFGYRWAGGMAGFGDKAVVIESCYNYGSIRTSGVEKPGGIKGYLKSGSNDALIKNCWYDEQTSEVAGLYGDASSGLNEAVNIVDSGSKPTAEMITWEFAKLMNGGHFVGDGSGTTTTVWTFAGAASLNKGYPVHGTMEAPSDWGVVGSWQTADSLKATTVTVDGASRPALTGDGTSDSPYIVSSPEALAWIGYEVNKQKGVTTLYVELGASIDLAGLKYTGKSDPGASSGYTNCLKWISIGIPTVDGLNYAIFAGGFDGKDHSIQNMYINTKLVKEGLFGCAGTNGSRVSIQNVILQSGSVTAGISASGLVGQLSNGTVKNCSNRGVAVTSKQSASGLIGVSDSNVSGSTVDRCFNQAPVTGGNSASGVFNSFAKNCTISNCFNTGTITVTEDLGISAAGIYTDDITASINNCYNAGKLVASKNIKVYAVGSSEAKMTNCWYDYETTGATVIAQPNVTKVTKAELQSWAAAFQLNNGTTATKITELGTWRKASSSTDNGGYPVLCTANQYMNPATDWSDVGRWVDVFATNNQPRTGDGSEASPFVIETPEAFAWYAFKVRYANGAYGSTSARLGARMDLSGTNYTGKTTSAVDGDYTNCLKWIPVGITGNLPYSGSFNGARRTISYMYVTDTYGGGASMFGYLSAGTTLKRIELEKSRVYGGNRDAAAIVLYMYGSALETAPTTISECEVAKTVNIYGSGVAGIVGTCSDNYARIENCRNEASITSWPISKSDGRAGGIITTSGSKTTIDNCINWGVITLNQNGSNASMAGGIVAYGKGPVQRCNSSGDILGSATYAGGISGYQTQGTIRDCWASTRVTGAIEVGGIAGHLAGNATLSNSFSYSSKTVATESGGKAGGVVGSALTVSSCTNSYYCLDVNYNSVGQAVGNFADTDTVKGMSHAAMTGPQFALTLNADRTASGTYPDVATWTWQLNSYISYPYIGEVAVTATGWDYVGSRQTETALKSAGELAGDGTEANPFVIKSPEALAWWAYIVNSDATKRDTHASLGADIDLAGGAYGKYSGPESDGTDFSRCLPWTPIGSGMSNPFSGKFNGNDHTITNLYVGGGFEYAGLFGYARGADAVRPAIENVKVLGQVAGDDTAKHAGLVLAYAHDYVTIQNCSTYARSSVATTHPTYDTTTGGVVGYAHRSWVYSCTNAATVSGMVNAGGILGAGSITPIESSSNSGTVSGRDVGGIVGLHQTQGATISKCANTGAVSAKSSTRRSGDWHVGGIAGWLLNITKIEDCYNAGDIASEAPAGVQVSAGGVAGYLTEKTKMARCYSYGQVTGTASFSGGAVGFAKDEAVLISDAYYPDDIVKGVTGAVGNRPDITGDASSQVKGVDSFELKNWASAYQLNGGKGASTPLSALTTWRKAKLPSENNGYPVLCDAGEKMDAASDWSDVGLWVDAFATEKKPAGDGSATGTGTGPFQLDTPEKLSWFAYKVNQGKTAGLAEGNQNAKITAAIDLTGNTFTGSSGSGTDLANCLKWTPIGTSDAPYSGTLEGSGSAAKITNMRIAAIEQDAVAAGFVGYAQGATLKNIDLSGNVYARATGTGTRIQTGLLVGFIRSDTRAEGCTVSGSVSASGVGDSFAGGLFGWLAGTVTDCSSSADVTAENSSGRDATAGGVAGIVTTGATVERCSSTGDITGREIGGIVGVTNASASLTLRDCFSSGTLTASAYAGGILGRNASFKKVSSISNSYSRVTFAGTGRKGCAVGFLSADSTLGSSDVKVSRFAYPVEQQNAGMTVIGGVSDGDPLVADCAALSALELKGRSNMAGENRPQAGLGGTNVVDVLNTLDDGERTGSKRVWYVAPDSRNEGYPDFTVSTVAPQTVSVDPDAVTADAPVTALLSSQVSNATMLRPVRLLDGTGTGSSAFSAPTYSLEQASTVKDSYTLWAPGADSGASADKKVALVTATDNTDLSTYASTVPSAGASLNTLSGISLYTASAYDFGKPRTTLLEVADSLGVVHEIRVTLEPVTSKVLDVAIQVQASGVDSFELTPDGSVHADANAAEAKQAASLQNKGEVPVIGMLKSASPLTGSDYEQIPLAKPQSVLVDNGDLITNGSNAKLGLKTETGSTAITTKYFDPSNAAPALYFTFGVSQEDKFRMFMDYSGIYLGTKGKFGYSLGYTIEVPKTDLRADEKKYLSTTKASR